MIKSALITGAANGLGHAMAHHLSRLGFHLVAIDVDHAALIQLRMEIPSVTCICIDLCCSTTVEKELDALSEHHFSLVVQAAAISATGKFEDIPADRMSAIIETNLYAPLMLTRLLLHKKLLVPKASLIFISSLSKYTAYPGGSVYAGTKEGLAQFANGLGTHSHDLNVTCVFPGPMDTAHASRYAPDNDTATVARRMNCHDVAVEILEASRKHRRVCVPGRANRLFAALARLMPGFVGHLLTKRLFLKMDRVRI